MIPELAEEDGADRKEDHAGNADRFIAGVERKQREDRGEADLLADEARLKGLAREGRDGVEDQEADAAGGIAVQKFEQRPRDEDGAGAKDGERVDERGQEGEKERIFRAEQEKPSRQDQEGEDVYKRQVCNFTTESSGCRIWEKEFRKTRWGRCRSASCWPIWRSR